MPCNGHMESVVIEPDDHPELGLIAEFIANVHRGRDESPVKPSGEL